MELISHPLFTALVAASVSVLTPLILRYVGSRWRGPQQALEAEIKALKAEAVDRTNELTEERIRRMFLEAKVETLGQELAGWRQGKWSPP